MVYQPYYQPSLINDDEEEKKRKQQAALDAQIAELGDIGAAAKAGQRYVPAQQSVGIRNDVLAGGGSVSQSNPYGPAATDLNQKAPHIPSPLPTGSLPSIVTPPKFELSPYGMILRENLPADATPAQTIERDIREAQDPRAFQEKKGFWNRLGTGLLAGVHDWNQAGQPGGPLGILGALGAGAVAHGISPAVDQGNRRRLELGRLMGKYGQITGPEKAQAERRLIQLDLQGKIHDVTNKGLDVTGQQLANVHAKYKNRMEQVARGGPPLTPAEAAEITAAGLPTKPEDFRQIEVKFDPRGLPYGVDKRGAPVAIPLPGHPVDPTERVENIKITMPNGQVIDSYMKSEKAGTTAMMSLENWQRARREEVKEETRKLERYEDKVESVHRLNISEARQYRTATLPIQIEIAKQLAAQAGSGPVYDQARGQYDNAIVHANDAIATLERTKPSDEAYGNALDKLENARKEANHYLEIMGKSQGVSTEARTLIEQLRQMLPPAPERLPVPDKPPTTTATATADQARKRFKLMGYSDTQIEEAIKRARAAGRIK